MIHIALSKRLHGAAGPIDFALEYTFEAHEFWAIFGESGIGKTTLLRMIAGLERPDAGVIEVGGVRWFDSAAGINLPPQRRQVGFVFQYYALFETMSVLENLLFAQPRRDEARAKALLETMGLAELGARRPRDLSGGQQQRVALARAIAQEPQVLLLDEPLSALDALTRAALQDELKRTHEQFGLLTLMVSHDRAEVFRLADRALWIKEGRLFRAGTPEEIFLPRTLSGKLSLAGQILSIRRCDIISIATVGIGQNIVEVVLEPSEAEEYRIGQEVVVAAKAFDPVLLKGER